MNKITEEELKTIQDQQTKLNQIIHRVGLLEAQKHAMLHDFGKTNEEVEEFKSELEQKYGQININVEDGTYTDIEIEEEETPVAAV